MDDISGSANNVITSLVQNARPGASVWTTFRWLGNAVYAVGWVCALPVELVLNRRMGRRYTGLLPVSVSLVVLSVFIGLLGSFSDMFTEAAYTPPRATWGAMPPAPAAAATGAGIGTGVLLTILTVVVLLAVVRHRFANWWRFRSADQVHSFSNGIPFWICPPRALLSVLPESKVLADRPPLPPVSTVPLPTVGAAMQAAATEITAGFAAEAERAVSQWRRGEVPTGAVVWIAATVIHPVLVAAASLLVGLVSPALGPYLWFAAIAMFFKARVQKAFVVESVYDMFDGRIEQEFKRSIAEPMKLDAVERAGLPVPGIARIVANASARPMSSALPPELDALITANPAAPASQVESKPGSATGAVP